ncbi:MAG: M23 family metallopeptidase [Micropruina sp.]|nr:MAG: M23 family metallopeptidase [Micropruina sp.]
MSAETLAAQRNQTLQNAANDVAQAQRQYDLAERQDGLSSAALEISKESTYLKERSVFLRPTAGKLGSPYGMRLHPILHYWRLHDGMDIGGNCGQPIVAASDGVVVKAAMGGYNGGSGNNVRIDSGDINGINVQEAYLHMQSISVSVGQKVVKGDLLGYVGSTGLSTACHLHFSVYENGKGTNPAKYLTL